MTYKEKLNILEDLLNVPIDTLKEDTLLQDLSEWDSIAVISLIAMFDDEFGKQIYSQQIKSFKTVKDIIDMME
ncbi:MAG TPA: acyl carrier protein [Ruminiclostridium sp.]|nr:acyl carrier protein [Ruminiclostridium sp.]